MKLVTMAACAGLCLPGLTFAQTAEELANGANDTSNVVNYGMGYNLQRFSTLKQIDKSNVKRLVPVWNYSLDDNRSEESQPLVYKGVIYITTNNATIAVDANIVGIDAKTGKELWRQNAADVHLGYSMTMAPLVADGVVITGVSGGEFGTRDFLDGWDPETGKHLWRTYTIPAPGEPGSETWKGDTW